MPVDWADIAVTWATFSLTRADNAFDWATFSLTWADSAVDWATFSFTRADNAVDWATFSLTWADSAVDWATFSFTRADNAVDWATFSLTWTEISYVIKMPMMNILMQSGFLHRKVKSVRLGIICMFDMEFLFYRTQDMPVLLNFL